MRKAILLSLALSIVSFCTAWSYGLVSNGPYRDTLAIPFAPLDSLGNPVDLMSGDSVYLAIFYPGGAISYRDSMAYNDTRIKSCDWEDFDGGKSYVFVERVSVLDGANPVNGLYSYILMIDDNSDADLITSTGGFFQVVNSPLEYSLDSAAWARRVVDSVNNVLDSLSKIIDSLESQSQWVLQPVTAGRKLAVSSGGYAAVDLDNVIGTLDATEIGIAAIDANKIHDAALTASKFQGTYYTVLIDSMSVREDSYPRVHAVEIGGTAADTVANRVLEDSLAYRGQIGISSGLYSYDVIILDSIINQVIPGVNIAIRNLEQSALIALGKSGNDGYAGFNLDADSLLAVCFSPGYIFDNFDTLVISGPGTDTVYGYRFDPGEPSMPSLCRLYGFIYGISGNPQAGAEITAWLPAGVTRAGAGLISPFKVKTTSNENGYFYLDLIPNNMLDPDTTRYEITVSRTDGTIFRERVTVPNQPGWLMTW
ncbi:MAG: hypothetical protein CVT49_08395 [candidate division Zixibacteria bacterium HGW-Zixibacteria-1]|nr:MAG: hypothetical protein CVT49_08395 [candidate division Zixibacteria bacterium HGW-Zixibacteria-1]